MTFLGHCTQEYELLYPKGQQLFVSWAHLFLFLFSLCPKNATMQIVNIVLSSDDQIYLKDDFFQILYYI